MQVKRERESVQKEIVLKTGGDKERTRYKETDSIRDMERDRHRENERD